jgi:hypothetical protein
MTASHQSGPHYIGPDTPRGEPSAQGAVVLTQSYTVDVAGATSGADIEAFRAPAGCSLLDVQVVVKTAANAATSSVLKLTDGTDDIVTGFNLKSTADSVLSVVNGDGSVADAALFLSPAASADTNLNLVVTESGDSTVGEVEVRLIYIQKP